MRYKHQELNGNTHTRALLVKQSHSSILASGCDTLRARHHSRSFFGTTLQQQVYTVHKR